MPMLVRLISASCAPRQGRSQYGPMLRELFDNCAVNGTISFDYDTRIFAGQLA